MKLSDMTKVAAVLNKHGAIADIESAVEKMTSTLSTATTIPADIKTKLGAALSSVVENEKTGLESELKALGVEVDTDVKTAASSVATTIMNAVKAKVSNATLGPAATLGAGHTTTTIP